MTTDFNLLTVALAEAKDRMHLLAWRAEYSKEDAAKYNQAVADYRRINSLWMEIACGKGTI